MPKIKMQTALCPSFEDAFERFIISKKAKGLSSKSIATYNNHYNAISKYIEPEMQMDKLSKADIEYMLAGMRDKGLAANSIASYTRTLRSFLSWANEEELTTVSCKQYKAEETVKDTYTDAELARLLKKPNIHKCTFSEYRNWVMINIYVALTDDKQAITAMLSDAAFSTIDEQAAARVAQEIWCADGKSWSTRVWNNINDLQQTLNDSLIDCIVSGKKTTQLKQTLMERFNVSYHRAETITRTEIAHIETQAAKDRYKSYGVQQVEILADTDSRTCDICARLDKKKFNINAQIPIPAHPNCRCCIIPVIDTKRTDDIMINNPIEQRNTGKGKANAVWSYGVSLNNRQQKLLDAMPQYDSRIIVSKNHVNMTDLAALTAETGVEFAMFTKGGDRLIIRGDSYSVNVDVETAQKLAEEGYKWSGHTHPGLDTFVLQASEGDYLILKQFKQKVSVIYNAKGDFRTLI